ncbi:MAG: YceD family protein [Verrucomicrobiota bacterium]
MPLEFNLRHLEKRNLELTGELTGAELELTGVDDMIKVNQPVRYDLVVERLNDSVLVRGALECTLDCTCVRCLQPFSHELALPDWTCDLPLEGEEKVTVSNDCVDLTPFVREDILLAFPQHPLCEPGCRGLLNPDTRTKEPASVDQEATGTSSAWAELNKLKF